VGPWCVPITEEIGLKIFESLDCTVFLSTLLSDGDSCLLPRKFVRDFGEYREDLVESYGDFMKTELKF